MTRRLPFTPYRLLTPAIGHPEGAILHGYPYPDGRVELLSNGRREMVAGSVVQPFIGSSGEAIENKPTARAEEYQEAIK